LSIIGILGLVRGSNLRLGLRLLKVLTALSFLFSYIQPSLYFLLPVRGAIDISSRN